MERNPGVGAQEGSDPWYLLKTIASKTLGQFLCVVLMRAHDTVQGSQGFSGSSSYFFQSRDVAQQPHSSAVVL